MLDIIHEYLYINAGRGENKGFAPQQKSSSEPQSVDVLRSHQPNKAAPIFNTILCFVLWFSLLQFLSAAWHLSIKPANSVALA
jgi:hypothetical protein